MISCILVEPESPGNIGSIARIMRNFNVEGNLILVNPCKISNDAYMMACNASEVIDSAIIVDTYDQARSMVDITVATSRQLGDQYNVRRIAISPSELADTARTDSNMGIVFGRESSGLTNAEVEESDLLVTIPSFDGYPTLNISHASAIIFYELFKKSCLCPDISLEGAKLSEHKMIVDDFNSILSIVEKHEYRKRNASVIFKHVLSRSFMTSREAYTLKGVFRKILRSLSE